jgi:hypothetical protein
MQTIDPMNRFGDRRLGARGFLLLGVMVATMRVIMQKADKWSDQIAYYRFFNNRKAREEVLIHCATGHCERACEGLEEVLLVQDTTELNLESHRRRITDRQGLGEVGNGRDLGFFCHPTIAVNPRDGALMGVADIYLMARERERDEAGNYKKQARDSGLKAPITEKESYRWIARGIRARERFSEEQRVTVIQDREGDIYESFCLLGEAGVDYVIRARHNRPVRAKEGGGKERLREHVAGMSPAYDYTLEVRGDNKQRQKREARLEVRYGEVRILRPGRIGGGKEQYPEAQDLWVVQAQERRETTPAGETGISWTLYTSRRITGPEEANRILGYYRNRWIIEEVFRAVKSEGVKYEATELETGSGLRKLLILALMAAVQIVQLRQARDGKTGQETSLLFSPEHVACMEDLLPGYEGATEKQQNPWPKGNLAWASWIIARLGGWKGYASQRPPGVITLYEGWTRFHAIFQGWQVAKDVYKR